MPSKKAIAWGCGIAASVVLLVIGAIVLFLVYVGQDVKGMGISVDGPADVVVGQSFQLSVTVTNERPRKAIALSDIDFAESYLAGFTISTVDPKPKSSMHVPVVNALSYTFDVRIPPATAKTFTFTLHAQKSGIYRGDVDVYEGTRFITTVAQTAVKEKE
jgi:hypothetical protein